MKLKQHKDKLDIYYLLFIGTISTLIYLLTFIVLFLTLSIDVKSMITLIGIITVVTVMYIDYLV